MGDKKSIFEYDNYREFLKDYYRDAKEKNPNFSYRHFSRQAGFKSSGLLKEVMDGKINIATRAIDKYVKALGLNAIEANFFRHLVQLNQAKTPTERETHAHEILRSRTYRELYPVKSSQSNYLLHWYFIPIRDLVNIKYFREDYPWMARQLQPRITAAEAKHAVDELLKLDLLARDEKGKLIQTQAIVSVGDQITASFMVAFHKEMIRKAAESLDSCPAEQRDVSSVTIGISSKTLLKVKEIIQKCRRDILNLSANESESDVIYQMNFQVFPLTKVVGSDE